MGRLHPLALVAVGTAIATAAACSLDWTVRTDVGDAGSDSSVIEISDAAGDGDADASPDVDAGPDVDCVALLASLPALKTSARACTVAASGECASSVKDECNCDVVVTFAPGPDAGATNDYADAAAVARATCSPGCDAGGCPSIGAPASWACVDQGGGTIACSP